MRSLHFFHSFPVPTGLVFLLAVLSAIALTRPAIAQEASAATETGESARASGPQLDEIIVTARRSAELLSEVPISISAFGDDQLEKLNINTLDGLSKFTPGLELTKWSQAGGYKLSLRGLYSDRGRSSVALRVDDIDSTAESIYNTGLAYLPKQRLMDLERIEVVKGAQVALYGRAAFGGAINYITKRPDLNEWSGNIDAGLSSELEYEATVRLNGPVVDDKLGVGLTAGYWEDGGSYNNQVSGERVGTIEGKGVAARLYFTPTSNLSNYTRIEFSNTETSMSPGVIVGPNADYIFDPIAAEVLGVPSTRYYAGVVPDVSENQIEIALDQFTGKNLPGVDSETVTATNIFEFDFGRFGFKSLSGFIDNRDENFQNTIYQPQPFVNADGSLNPNGDGVSPGGWTTQSMFMNTDVQIINQELQLFSNQDQRFRWQVGLQYWNEDLEQDQTQPTVVPTGPISAPAVIQFMAENTLVDDANFAREVEHWSGYLWAEYDLSDTLSISLEGRYANEDITYVAEGRANVSLGIPDSAGGEPTFTRVTPITPLQKEKISTDYFIPKATITYKPGDDLTLYASAAKSTQPPGYDVFNGVLNDFSSFTEEELWTYEVGVKSRLANGRLDVDAAFFYQDYSGEQVATVVVDPVSNLPTAATENAGTSRRFGLDVGLEVRPTENLTFSINYIYLDTKFTEFEFFTQSAVSASQGPCVRTEMRGPSLGCIISLEGNASGHSPEHQFSAFANYTAALPGSDGEFFIEPNVRFKDERFLNASNNEIAPSFWRVDLRLGVRLDRLEITAYATNLLDDETPIDLVSFFDYQQSFLPASLTFVTDPRTFGFNARYRF